MSFVEAQERLQEAVFDRLGEDAAWDGFAGPVRVIRREYDEESRWNEAVEVKTVRFIRVRRSEVPAPVEGTHVQILDAAVAPIDGALYVLSGEPQLNRKGVWTCPVTLV